MSAQMTELMADVRALLQEVVELLRHLADAAGGDAR